MFPKIQTIDDILPFIRGNDSFVHLIREDYQVIDYVNQFSAFPEDDPNLDILLECRGLIFNLEGKIISRAFSKFFNYTERTHHKDLNWTGACALDKLDGSLVRPIRIGQGWRLATRKGITDVACQAELHLVRMLGLRSIYYDLFEWCELHNQTPIFEWCSRENRVVLDYPKPQLVLLDIRDNITGQYKGINHEWCQSWVRLGIPAVQQYPFDCSPEELVNQIRGLSGQEGIVVVFPNQERVKIKAEEYCGLHRTKSYFDSEKNIIQCIKEDKLDDLRPLLAPDQLKRLDDYVADYMAGIKTTAKLLWDKWMESKPFRDTKRDYAVEFVNKQENHWKPVLFWMWEFSRSTHIIKSDKQLWNHIEDQFVKSNTNEAVERSRWIHGAVWKQSEETPNE